MSLLWMYLPGLVSLATLAWGLVWSARESRALLQLRPAPLRERLTVLIPARNEEERLDQTLRALLREEASDLQVVVYDDRSTDDTAAVAERHARSDVRVHVVDGHRDPPPARFGKPAALARALAHAESHFPEVGHYVLLLDADVVLERGTLGALVAAARTHGATALSGMPRLQLGSVAERCLVPSFVALAGRRFAPSRVHDDEQDTAFLNGQLILVVRDALHRVDDFARVEDAILEDVALAHELKAAGGALRLADLRPWAQTRMYRTFAEIDAGFGKNAVPLQGGVLAALGVGLLSPFLAGAGWYSLGAAIVGEGLALRGGALLLGVGVTACQLVMRRRLGVPAWPALLAGPLSLVVAWTYVRAALRVWRGRPLRWRGRAYRASRR